MDIRDREDREDSDRQDKRLGVDRDRERGRKLTTSYSTRSPEGVFVCRIISFSFAPCVGLYLFAFHWRVDSSGSLTQLENKYYICACR